MDPRANEWGRSRSKWSLGGGGTHLRQRNWNLRRPPGSQPDDCLSHQTCQLRLSHTHFIVIFLPQLKACSVLPSMVFPVRQTEDLSLNMPHILSRPPKSRATGLGQGREILWCWGRRRVRDSRLLLKPSRPEALPLCHV